MPLLSRLASLRRNILRKDRVESDLDAELQSCLAILAEQKIEAGMSEEEA